MVKLNQFVLVCVFFLLVLTIFSLADESITQEDLCTFYGTNICESYPADEICLDYYSAKYTVGDVEFNETTNTCYYYGNATLSTASTTPTTKNYDASISSLTQEITSLKSLITALQSRVVSSETDYNNLRNQLSSLNVKLQNLESQLKNVQTDTSNNINSLATGQASLQDELNSTISNLQNVETNLAEQKAFDQLIKIIFFTLLTITIALGIIYFTTKQSGFKKPSSEIVNYFTQQIKAGKKYPQIKAELIKSGWKEEEINWAYKHTIKHNYTRYLNQKSGQGQKPLQKSDAKSSSFNFNKMMGADSDVTKIISIVVVGLLLVIGVFFIGRGIVTGQAYQLLFNPQTEEFVAFNCTGDHILNPAEDGCCTDTDPKNNICDYIDRYMESATASSEEGKCTENLQCVSGQFCVNQECKSLSDIYSMKGCASKCNYQEVEVETSDGETFTLKPKRGSYTGAGSLEWQIMESPDYCKGEEALVPILIIKKEPGTILSEEIITLKDGETSAEITHPNVASLSFYLEVKEIIGEECS